MRSDACGHASSRCVVAVIATLVLTACGGGGGGAPASNPAPAPANPAPTPPATYAIGGAVSGLSGSGLTLKNGSENLAVASGAFVFTQRAESGRTYDVAIVSQPKNPSQTCLVQRGSGTLAATDITDIAVQCTTDRFTVGGTTVGLVGAGLRLQDASGDSVALTADGAFQLPKTIGSGDAYNVQIVAQPRAPAQVCSIAGGSGMVRDAPVASIQVTCVAQTFTVGGTVTGLQGSGLKLTSPAGGALVVESNGSFVLPDALATGATYDVAVVAQPASAVVCRIVDRSGRGVIDDAAVTTIAVACGAREPPPMVRFCDGSACNNAPPIKVRICPEIQPTCTPTRSTRIQLRVDGTPVSGGFITFNNMTGMTAVRDSGNGQLYATFLQFTDAPYVEVRSNSNVTFSYYDVMPNWGGTTTLDFVSTLRSNSVLDATFYRYTTYAAPTAADDLFANATQAVAVEQRMVDATSEKLDAHFVPTELAAYGEGNFSFGDGTVSINYGNPLYIQHLGGILNTSMPRFAHENAHELFDEIERPYQNDATCLNEGIADALGFKSGFLPEQDFGPRGLRGLDFELDGCQAMTDVHDIGNCPLWHVKQANQLTPAFMRGLFHPQHDYAFDSCTLDRHTGNSLLVLFTEAAGGANMIPVLDAARIPHAVSYQAAKTELGL